MPKIVNPDIERDRIIQGFQRCILSKPMADVSLRDIANEVGISHGSIFTYFSGKKDIIAAYAKYIADVYSAAFENITAKIGEASPSSGEMLRALFASLYEIDKENTVEKLYAQVYVLGQYDEEIRQVVLNAYAQWRLSILVMLRRIRPDLDENAARSILVVIEGILIYRMNDRLAKEDAVRIVADLMGIVTA